mmetsp:Transcript_21231/g.59005  ORF Transcript_21231/g.59005 Transcript_21231/m.59005 type:complete len:1188 (+) Transcript_21231:285-3848(+)
MQEQTTPPPRRSLSVKVGPEEAEQADVSEDIGALAADSAVAGPMGSGLSGQRTASLQKQLLWTKRFKTLTRAIDDLYLVCEVERDATQVGEAIGLLRRACTDFQLLHECIGSAQTTPESSCSTVSKTSGAVSWEVPISATSNRFAPSRRTTSDLDDSDSRATPDGDASPVDPEDHGGMGGGGRGGGRGRLGIAGYGDEEDDSAGFREEIVSRFVSDKEGRAMAPAGIGAAGEGSEPTGEASQLREALQAAQGNNQPADSPGASDLSGGSTVIQAWKAKRNWGAILVENPTGSEDTGRWRRCSQLHRKLMSPDRKKKTPQETKKMVDEKQASAQERRLRIESERLAKLAKAEAGRQAAAQVEAERLQALVQDISERHQRSAAQRLAHLDKVSRKAGDQVKKVREVAFIQELTKQDRKMEIQERLEEGEARRQERLAAVRERQKDTDLAMEQAQERRQRLEEERRERLARKEEKKAAAQAKLLEDRRAEQQAREARAEQQRAAAEERAAAEAKDARDRSDRLEERLREADVRRLMHLETIKERAMFSKEERRDPCTPTSSPTGARLLTSAWGSAGHSAALGDSEGGGSGTLMRSSDGSVTAATTAANRRKGARRRAKKLLKQLEAAPLSTIEEPPHVRDAMGTYMGTERCAHWRCATAKLQRLATEGDPVPLESLVANLTAGLARCLGQSAASPPSTSDSTPGASHGSGNGGNSGGPLPMTAVELHAVRVGGALGWVAKWAGWPPTRGWNKSLQLKLLRLWGDSLRVAENCRVMLDGVAACGVAKQAVAALEALAARPPLLRPPTPKSGRRKPGGSRSQPERPPPPTEAAMDDIISGRVTIDTDEMLLEAQLQILTRVLAHVPEHNEELMRRRSLFVSYIISSGILNGLHSMFALFDRPFSAGLYVPSHVDSALQFLKALTAYPPPQPLNWPLESSAVPGPNVPAMVLALKEQRLLGLTSFLTGFLLRASPDGSVANASVDALPTNFVEIVTAALRVLTAVAMLDLKVAQELLGAPDLCMETYHLIHYLLSFCTLSWDTNATTQEGVQELLEETLMLVGLCMVGNAGNQCMLQWGKSPNIVQLLCKLPFPCFVNPRLRAALMPVFLSSCCGNTSITEVMETVVACDFLLQFLQAENIASTPAELPRRLQLPMRFPSALLGVVEQQLQSSAAATSAASATTPPPQPPGEG